MSISRPVPAWRPANRGVAYQSVRQFVVMLASIAYPVCSGPSPSAVPFGPKAAALTGLRIRTASGVGEAELAFADGLGVGLGDVRGDGFERVLAAVAAPPRAAAGLLA
jgi:hypothetical protein